MSGLALFRRINESQALVKAPSMDLIVSDTGPRLPEPIEITCQMTAEQFKTYAKAVGYVRSENILLQKESLKQTLKILGYKSYPYKEVCEFLYQQAKNFNSAKKFKRKVSVCWSKYSEYALFIPPKIVNKMREISSNPYSFGPAYYRISDLYNINGFKYIIKKGHADEICFLAVSFKTIEPYHFQQNYYEHDNIFIIDAWRGPTFSDEESKI